MTKESGNATAGCHLQVYSDRQIHDRLRGRDIRRLETYEHGFRGVEAVRL